MTLIMVAAVLAILAALATGFYTMMLMQTKSATRYSDAIRAEMMARGGIEFAVAQLHTQAFKKIEDPTDPWFMVDYMHGAKRNISYPDSPYLHNGADDDADGTIDNPEEARFKLDEMRGYSRSLSSSTNDLGGGDCFSLNIFDSGSRINVNACDNLGTLLDNLCRVIGPPLVAADQNYLIPRVWEWYGGAKFNNNPNDWPKGGAPGGVYGEVARDIFYNTYDKNGTLIPWFASGKVNEDVTGRPALNPKDNKTALFGDGYAIAGYRARKGLFKNLEAVKHALTYVERSLPPNNIPDDPLEQLEVEVKFAAIRDYITVDSWVDTTTVCTGKFEWVPQTGSGGGQGADYEIAIDRDKSWIPDDPVGDPENKRGSLRGSYVTIVNGHGAGQVRRIRTNGVDWIQVEAFQPLNGGATTGFTIPPGPTSSYMIYAREDALLEDLHGSPATNVSYNGTLSTPPKPPTGLPTGSDPLKGTALKGIGYFPKMKTEGAVQYLDDDPHTDYSARPLCIHRAPININTASDKVLAAMFMGLNVTHGHFLSIGTDADLALLAQYSTTTGKLKSRYAWNPADPDWKIGDFDDVNNVYRTVEPYILTPKGMKRIPGSPGRLKYDVDYVANYRPKLNSFGYDMDYINNYNMADPAGTNKMNEAHELAMRILIARQYDPACKYIDPKTGMPSTTVDEAYRRGPFTNWDDFYFRVVKPWDTARQDNSVDGTGIQHKASVGRLIMAHFNPNTDILKFNPNIEWIDRWGRNFTEMEPVMVYTNQQETPDQISRSGHGRIDGWNAKLSDISVCDLDGFMNPDAVPVFSRERTGWGSGGSEWFYFVCGIYGTDPKWMGSYVTRSFRYKSDEMIDKTDLNRSTTEFSFNSGGVYEIQSIGQVLKRGEVLAERKAQALVRVYHVWRESTQQQFVNGYIKEAEGNPGDPDAGAVARDYKNDNKRLSLNTLPEPLVPLRYRIVNPLNTEVVDVDLGGVDGKRDAWGQPVNGGMYGVNSRPIEVPGVVANRVLPAAWDGQLVLATNTQRYDPNENGDDDTFLASFNGDLDTETCRGNGHEQAKTPIDHKVPVLDTMSLLGALNDNQMDSDPGLIGLASWNATGTYVKPDLPPPWGTSTYNTSSNPPPMDIFRYQTVRNALRGLRPDFYWNNVTCRQGDLRNDGVFVGGPGVAGNDGVMKYLCGVAKGDRKSNLAADAPANYETQNFSLNGKNAVRARGEQLGNAGKAGDVKGWLLSMWTKTTWHHNDNRSHEFFDCTTPGWATTGIRAEAFWLRKQGGPQFAVCEQGSSLSTLQPAEDPTWGVSGAGNRVNDFSLIMEPNQNSGDWSESDFTIYLHGGSSGVPNTRTDPGRYPGTYQPESPSYRVQPFRWHFVGCRIYLSQDFSKNHNLVNGISSPGGPGGSGKSGFWKSNQNSEGWEDNNSLWLSANIFRPFIDSERFPDGPNYSAKAKFWVCHQTAGASGFVTYQDKGRAGNTGGSTSAPDPVVMDWGPGRGDGGQPVRYRWASPGGTRTADGLEVEDNPIFGLNNCNPGRGYNGSGNEFCSIYRGTPEEGTFAVIDEFKMSRKENTLRNPWKPKQNADPVWGPLRPDYDGFGAGTSDRVARSGDGEMYTSRYYLPRDPKDRNKCPQFTSQSMLQSLKGYDKKGNVVTGEKEKVTLARVSWNVFTPRFLHENKVASGKFTRDETITKRTAQAPTTFSVPFRGPFDYCKYNNLLNEKYEDFDLSTYDNNPTVLPFRCARATPADYQNADAKYKSQKSYHASLGVEVAILEDVDFDPSNYNEIIRGNGGKPFTNPTLVNQILGPGGELIRVEPKYLRYRVYFRYPVDQLADKGAGDVEVDRGYYCVNPASMYLLDTPVFDDISITYFTKPRILDYRDVLE
ncbi:MAG TPA: hypothetical protein VEK08_02950 [Planctomycetota bacterium]|nr:hypothetical protein [Planctomycetota bacterium]